MKVLVACEFSGVVRDAFTARGHYAMSCDLLPSETEGPHHRGDIREVFEREAYGHGWDLMIAHPPCTYLCSSGLHWNTRVASRAELTERALAFVQLLMGADVPRIALENPVGRIGTAIRKADQTVQPHQFGHNASKATCLWLKNLPPLVPTQIVAPRMVDGRPRWSIRPTAGRIVSAQVQRGGSNGLAPMPESPRQWPTSGEASRLFGWQHDRRKTGKRRTEGSASGVLC